MARNTIEERKNIVLSAGITAIQHIAMFMDITNACHEESDIKVVEKELLNIINEADLLRIGYEQNFNRLPSAHRMQRGQTDAEIQ